MEGMDKLNEIRYTGIRPEERSPVMSELYRKMQPFLGDETKLIQRMAGRMDLWEECVRLFPGEEILNETDEALQMGDDTLLYQTIHRLKGNLANFGFDSAAEKAMGILQAIKEHNRTQIECSYAKLREEYMQIIERIGDTE